MARWRNKPPSLLLLAGREPGDLNAAMRDAYFALLLMGAKGHFCPNTYTAFMLAKNIQRFEEDKMANYLRFC